MIVGQCNCGAVSFKITADPSEIIICRRYSGNNGVAVIIVDRSNFQWLCGEADIQTWKKKPDADWRAFFCRTCGSALPGPNDDTRMFVPAGLMTHDSVTLKVAHHIWVSSKAGWDEIGDDGEQHVDAFAG